MVHEHFLLVTLVLSLVFVVQGSDEHFGKRITSSLVAELGKRPKEMYSFGIGKRSISDDEMEEFLEESSAKQSASEPNAESLFSSDKRDPYAFGLGKRGREYNFGLGKKRDPYAFGLGKRAQHLEYAFGMGKKEDPYAFGLGKRADRYAFGLGKRDPYAFGLGKREPFAFGLGKRDSAPYAYGLGRKRDPYSFGLGK